MTPGKIVSSILASAMHRPGKSGVRGLSARVLAEIALASFVAGETR